MRAKYFIALIIVILLLAVAAGYSQSKVDQNGSLVPTGAYPLAEQKVIKGNIYNVQSIAERNAIPTYLRTDGFQAYVADSLKNYQLRGGIANANWVDLGTGGGGGGNTIIQGAYVGDLAGLRANTSSAVKTANLRDRGTGQLYFDSTDVSSADNDVTIIVDAGGRRYKRPTAPEIQVDWGINTLLSDTADRTVSLQNLVNVASGGKLQFTRGKKYRSNRVWLPMGGIEIDLNGAYLSPSLRPQYATPIFSVEPFRNSNTTGLYVGGTNNPIAPNEKICRPIKIYGGIVDLENTTMSFANCSLAFSFNTVINEFNVSNNTVQSFSRQCIAAVSYNFINDTTSFIRKVIFDNNYISGGGPFGGICLTDSAFVNDTIVKVRTLDKVPIDTRLLVGRYFQIGSHLTSSGGLDNTGYATTNKVFRLKGFTLDPTDSSKATLRFTSGSYSTTNGFIDSVKGLTAVVIPNAFVLPCASFSYGVLMSLPTYDGVNGTNKLTIVAHNTTQDAFLRNAYPGVKFTFNTPSTVGTFTIVSVYNDSLILDKVLPQTVTNLPLIPYGTPAAAFNVGGDIKDVYIRNNTMQASSHAGAISGEVKARTWAENYDNNYLITGNTTNWNWMSFEMTNGGTARTTTMSSAILDDIAVTSGSNWITINSPANYRQSTKDLGFGSRKVFTLVGTIDANITVGNSIGQNDLIGWYGLHYTYKIVDFDTTGGIKRVKIARWDNSIKDTTAGGIEATVAATNNWFRKYCEYYGQEGSIRKMEFRRNKFGPNMRNEGGAGYHISGRAHEYIIDDNDFESSEQSCWELEGNSAVVNNNRVNMYTFIGDVARPSLAKLNGASGRGFNGWGTSAATRTSITNNKLKGNQPATFTGYNPNSGTLLIGQSAGSLDPQTSLIIKNNEIDGQKRGLLGVVTFSVLGGVSIPTFYYDDVEISDNKIKLNDAYVDDGLWRYHIGRKTTIQNNKVMKAGGTALTSIRLFLANQYPNYELIDSTSGYVYNVDNNTYPATAISGVPFNNSKWFWNDLKNRVRPGFGVNQLVGTLSTDETQLVPLSLKTINGTDLRGAGNITTGSGGGGGSSSKGALD